jgi:hypothetical protein
MMALMVMKQNFDIINGDAERMSALFDQIDKSMKKGEE